MTTQPRTPIDPATASIMCVEDNIDNIFGVEQAIRKFKHDLGLQEQQGPFFNARASGRYFFEWIDKGNTVDLLLLDLQIPRENGYTVLAQIRARPELTHLVVIALTANVMDADVISCRNAGFDGFIGKPTRINRLSTQLARILNGEAVWEPH